MAARALYMSEGKTSGTFGVEQLRLSYMYSMIGAYNICANMRRFSHFFLLFAYKLHDHVLILRWSYGCRPDPGAGNVVTC